jgi:hypothetical protein
VTRKKTLLKVLFLELSLIIGQDEGRCLPVVILAADVHL